MSLLDSLSRGLRGAAGVLSPDIQKQTMQQDQQNAILGQQQKMAILQHVQQQVQAGALPPEAGQAIAAKIGAPPELVGNVGVDAQAKMQALKNETGYRAAVAAANGDKAKIASASMQFGKPEIAMQLYKSEEDRMAALERHRDNIETKLLQIETMSNDKSQSREMQERLAKIADETRREGQRIQLLLGQQANAVRELALSVRAAGGREPAPHYERQDDGTLLRITRDGVATPVTDAEGKPVKARGSERFEQKQSIADLADTIITRLEASNEANPRSTTGVFAGPVRAIESVVNSVVPGSIGSQATIANQDKERLLSLLTQLQGGSSGRLSNQDMKRVDAAIGAIRSGTQEGLAQGLKDARSVLNITRGNSNEKEPPTKPTAPATREDDMALINKYLKKTP